MKVGFQFGGCVIVIEGPDAVTLADRLMDALVPDITVDDLVAVTEEK